MTHQGPPPKFLKLFCTPKSLEKKAIARICGLNECELKSDYAERDLDESLRGNNFPLYIKYVSPPEWIHQSEWI